MAQLSAQRNVISLAGENSEAESKKKEKEKEKESRVTTLDRSRIVPLVLSGPLVWVMELMHHEEHTVQKTREGDEIKHAGQQGDTHSCRHVGPINGYHIIISAIFAVGQELLPGSGWKLLC